jgi:hypothetical protein
MPFRHPDRSADLGARIEFEVRERIEEAVDYVCLEALVRARRARGLPPPSAESAADKAAYTANVVDFLDRLRRELTADIGSELQSKLPGPAGSPDGAQAQLMATQVVLARMLPDYWQRFDAARARYLAEAPLDEAHRENAARRAGGSGLGADNESGSEGRGLLARLFGRG